jgi:hypothetical protein
MFLKFESISLKERDRLGDLLVDGSIILKSIVRCKAVAKEFAQRQVLLNKERNRRFAYERQTFMTSF